MYFRTFLITDKSSNSLPFLSTEVSLILIFFSIFTLFFSLFNFFKIID